MKNKILTGSILAVALLGTSFAFSTTQNYTEIVNSERAIDDAKTDANALGVGAFANLDSFDNDGFNHGVKTSYIKYLTTYGSGEGTEADGAHKAMTAEEAEKYFGEHSRTSNYSDDGHEYVEMFNQFFTTNSIAVSAGFQVANAFNGMGGAFDGVFTDKTGTNTDLANHNNAAIVLLDDASLAASYNNAASISFAAEGAGFLAAIGAAVYTQYDAEVNNIEIPNIVMWGGMPFPTVYDFMSGFAQGITDANTWGESQEWYKEITLWNGGLKKNDTIEDTAVYGDASNEADANAWYTKGFSAATGVADGDIAKVKTTNAIKADASVVFPIAGGNTSIAEAEIAKNSGTHTRMMGVDADSSLSAQKPELYLGTAEKNLEMGGYLGLWAMDDADDDGERNFNDSDATAPDEYAAWNPDTTTGVQLHGDIDNGGVGFNYVNGGIMVEGETDISKGYSLDLVEAWKFVAEKTTWDATAEGFEALLAEAQDKTGTIEAADSQFTAADMNANSVSGNLTWLWITLGVVLGLGVIGLIVWLVLRKKEEA